MNLPNRLTLLRCALVPFVVLLMIPLSSFGDNDYNRFIESYGMIIALIIFAIASFTDFLDGYLARKRGQVTNLGKFLDPIADKVLVIAVLIAFVQIGTCHAVVPILVLFREFTVTGIRLLAIERGQVIAASYLGKAKTVTQMIAIVLLMLHHISIRFWGGVEPYLFALSQAALVLCLIMTVWSGVDYLVKSLYLFKEPSQQPKG